MSKREEAFRLFVEMVIADARSKLERGRNMSPSETRQLAQAAIAIAKIFDEEAGEL